MVNKHVVFTKNKIKFQNEDAKSYEATFSH